jgi:hypothetical protein
MDNLIAEGKARPFLIVIGNSYIPGMSGPGAVAPMLEGVVLIEYADPRAD